MSAAAKAIYKLSAALKNADGEEAAEATARVLLDRMGTAVALLGPQAIDGDASMIKAISSFLFELMGREFHKAALTTSDALLALGLRDPMIVASAAQALCDLGADDPTRPGAPVTAIRLLEGLLDAGAPASLGLATAYGSLGRANKDLFASALVRGDDEAAERFGRAAIVGYRRGFEIADQAEVPAETRWAWRGPMTNVLTIGSRMLSEGFDLADLAGPGEDVKAWLDGVADDLERRTDPQTLGPANMQPWDYAARAEAAMYRGNADDAAHWLDAYVTALFDQDEAMAPFKLNGTLRQWTSLVPQTSPAVTELLNEIRNALLQNSRRPARLDARFLSAARTDLSASFSVQTRERLYGGTLFDVDLLRDLAKAAASVGAILLKDECGRRVATGFAVRCGDLFAGLPEPPASRPVLLTNAHVTCWRSPFVTDDGESVAPERLAVRFEEGEAPDKVFDLSPFWPKDHDVRRAIEWLDAAILQIVGEEEALARIPTIPVARDFNARRVYVVGYPDGGTAGVFLGGNDLIDPPSTGRAQHVFYKASTMGGHSGSPVLLRAGAEIRAAAVHIGANIFADQRRGANFGLRLSALAATIKAEPATSAPPAPPSP